MDRRNNPTYRRLIQSTRWRRLRADVLHRACGLCEDCRARGVVRAATEVHHIEPVERGVSAAAMERLMFDPRNLVALCHGCHANRHAELMSHNRERSRALARARLEAVCDALATPDPALMAAAEEGGRFLKGGGGGRHNPRTLLCECARRFWNRVSPARGYSEADSSSSDHQKQH